MRRRGKVYVKTECNKNKMLTETKIEKSTVLS